MGDPGANGGKFVGISQEVHNFLQLLLLFVGAGYIVKSNLLAVGNTQNGPGFAEVVQRVVVVVHPAHHQGPDEQQDQSCNDQRQNQIKGRPGFRSNDVVGFQNTGVGLLPERLCHFGQETLRITQGGGYGGLTVVGIVQLHGDLISADQEALHLLLLEQLGHAGIGDAVAGGIKDAGQPAQRGRQDQQIQNHGKDFSVLQWWRSPYYS